MKKLSILWVLIIMFLFQYDTMSFSRVVEEKNGLLKIKSIFQPFNNHTSSFLLSWVDNENSDCCGWELVKCDNNTGRVIRLDFYFRIADDGESVALDASIFLPFQQLQYLDLSNYYLSSLQNGRDLGNLKKLKVLILSYNKLNNIRFISTLTSLTALDISSNYINGSLADFGKGLCKLKNLQELHLGFNRFSGSIPACFNNLTSLRVLDLSNNNLVGSLHSSLLLSLKRLEYFSLNENLYDGSLMFNTSMGLEFQFKLLALSNCNLNISTTDLVKFLHNQPNLIWLDLSQNSLHGEFSNRFFENNSKLKVVSLRNNSLTGHIHFPVGPLVNLETLDVSENHIQGELQPNFGEVLPKLTYLYLSNNDLRGGIPTSILNMKNLKKLDLSNNNLSGKLPMQLGLSCKKLEKIHLSNNKLEGRIPDTLFNLTELTRLELSNNQFTGHIPSNNFQSLDLDIFDINQNHISGKIPRWLCNLTMLSSLDFSENQLSGPMLSCLITVPNLMYLDLKRNKLTGPLPKALTFNTSELLTLDLSHNNLSGEIPNWYGFLMNLRVLLMKGNHFNGSIPHELCHLQEMGILDLSYNSLSGSIPICFSNIAFGNLAVNETGAFELWSNYPTFVADQNMFSDLIIQPAWFAFLTDPKEIDSSNEKDVEFMMKSRSNSYKGDIINYMSGIDLSSNNLKGDIPHDIGSLIDLRALNLSHNQFTGVIPSSLSNMKQIESIDLSHNKLSGEIPSNLIRLTTLVYFIVAYNNLSGQVPEMVAQFSTFNETSYEGNPFLCGPPLLRKQCKISIAQVPITKTLAGQNDVFGIDPISFLASFGATYVTCLMGFVIVLCINPYWRRRWFHFIDTCLSFVFPSWY